MVRRNREKKGGVVALSTISAVQSPFHRLVNPNSDNLTIQNTQLAGSPRVNGRSPALPSTQQDGNVFGSPGGLAGRHRRSLPGGQNRPWEKSGEGRDIERSGSVQSTDSSVRPSEGAAHSKLATAVFGGPRCSRGQKEANLDRKSGSKEGAAV